MLRFEGEGIFRSVLVCLVATPPVVSSSCFISVRTRRRVPRYPDHMPHPTQALSDALIIFLTVLCLVLSPLLSMLKVLTFRVPPFYSLIVRTLTILEGLALFVDPDFRLIKV